MSNENEKNNKRSYKLKARAKRQEQVHERITLAAVKLHGTVGPANTTMNAIAELAGVQRATVYNHFPTDYELIDACSSHWMNENPPPDSNQWAAIEDWSERLETALNQMYDYYEQGQEMLDNIMRDAPQIPALRKILNEKWIPMLEANIAILSGNCNTANINHVKTSIRIALDFQTWKLLSTSDLSNSESAKITTSWIKAVL